MTETARHPARWPLIVTALILVAILVALWQIWAAQRDIRARADAQEERLASLVRERQELDALLALEPCEAAARLAPVSEAKPVSEAPPVSEAKPVTKMRPAAKAAEDPDMIERACVFLVSTDGRSGLSTGSGFFVAPGYVLTNRHVVANGAGRAFVTSAAMGEPAVAQVVAVGKGKNEDFALLRLKMPPQAATTVLPLARDARKTEKVGAWGFPHLVGENDPAYMRLMRGDLSAAPELSYTEGVVSAILPGEPGLIVHTAPISPGNSGGPLLNAGGEVIGINSMIQLDNSSYRQASLAIAAQDLLRFLASAGIAGGRK